ncbi:unnamed protein product [Darwinula stevensoni]|uniref:Peroxisomal targeting signal 1 receptor n=1 Tax=Darwinula stevensoni TaxID=69355 RepID=A0A7R8ZY59_9CRUS|nr:unnamed protein product [Darwinula stevensoni]CAG0880873.1 unnamed protein product [Darwinula stevensoni]
MPLKDLVGGECGQQSSLVQVSQQLLRDRTAPMGNWDFRYSVGLNGQQVSGNSNATGPPIPMTLPPPIYEHHMRPMPIGFQPLMVGPALPLSHVNDEVDSICYSIEEQLVFPQHLDLDLEANVSQEEALPESVATDSQEGAKSRGASQQEEKDEYWNHLREEWEKLAEEGDHPWLGEFDPTAFEPFKEYKFAEENPLKDEQDPMAEGKRRLQEGDVPSAALLFEAAVQKEPQNVEAWLHLGTTQALNEQDPNAIAALRKCLELDEGNLTALMALAVSYTNESYQAQASSALKEWLKRNPKYSHLVKEGSSPAKLRSDLVSSLLSSPAQEELRDQYLDAARLATPENSLDPDVQCGLGVLLNLTGDYERAVECFQAALQARPQDPLLWNRLGATLANGGRSEEAIHAYHQALTIYPGFVRCRYNLGISCINLGAHKEAAEHFLYALSFQSAARGLHGQMSSTLMSSSIWSSLRMVLSLLGRRDLFQAVDDRDLKRLNQEFPFQATTEK